MVEEFRIAVQVMISRRLESLLRIDENIKIDTSYITCAEYQLFLDDQKPSYRNNSAPEHWIDNRFSKGFSRTPVTGVRADQAADFCEWLTHKYMPLGSVYRIPTIEESKKGFFDYKDDVGYWCLGSADEKSLTSISKIKYKKEWKLILLRFIDEKFRDSIEGMLQAARDTEAKVGFADDLAIVRNLKIDIYITLDLVLSRLRSIDTADIVNDQKDNEVFINERMQELNFMIYQAKDSRLSHALWRSFENQLSSIAQKDNTGCMDLRQKKSCESLLISSYWILLGTLYRRNFRVYRYSGTGDHLSVEYFVSKSCTALSGYTHYALVELRRTGTMPAWESIRIIQARK